MEQQLAAPPEEGEEPKSATEVVADVLDDSTKKNMFLQNVGSRLGDRGLMYRMSKHNWKWRSWQMLSFMQKWMIWKRERRKKNKQG